jgi:ABC-type glutathione transport system ATPase component
MINLPEPLLRVGHLTKTYLERHAVTNAKVVVEAFTDVNLTIYPGTTTALVGESGAGKSSLARSLALLERPTHGEIWFEGVELLSLGEKGLVGMRQQIQMIFQDPTSALNPRLTALEIIREPLVIQRQGTDTQRRAQALDLMEEVGLPREWEGKTALEFSGGQRQRLAIARALALEPKLLILDEALSNLDIANQEMILKLLKEVQAAHPLAYLHISHDLRLVSRFAEELAVMHAGKIVEQGGAAKMIAHPSHPYTQELFAAMPSLESICEERFA